MMVSPYCGVFEARTLEDVLGTTCARPARIACSDCGLSLCSAHSEECDLCQATFCPTCLWFHKQEHAKPAHSDSRDALRKTA